MRKLTAAEVNAWIAAVLSNDETSTDEDLVRYFMAEAPMGELSARTIVRRRDEYLNDGGTR